MAELQARVEAAEAELQARVEAAKEAAKSQAAEALAAAERAAADEAARGLDERPAAWLRQVEAQPRLSIVSITFKAGGATLP